MNHLLNKTKQCCLTRHCALFSYLIFNGPPNTRYAYVIVIYLYLQSLKDRRACHIASFLKSLKLFVNKRVHLFIYINLVSTLCYLIIHYS